MYIKPFEEYLKTFEDLDYMGSEPVYKKKIWMSKDEVSEALFGLEVSTVEFTNNGKPTIQKIIKNNEDLKSTLESISEFFNPYIKFTLSDDGIKKLVLFFDPKSKEYVGQGNEMTGEKNTYQLAFDKLTDVFRSSERKVLYYDTLKNAIGTDWDWDINIKYKPVPMFTRIKSFFRESTINTNDFEEGREYITYRGDVPYYNRHGNRSTGFYLRERPFEVISINRHLITIRYNGDIWSIKPEDLKKCQFKEY